MNDFTFESIDDDTIANAIANANDHTFSDLFLQNSVSDDGGNAEIIQQDTTVENDDMTDEDEKNENEIGNQWESQEEVDGMDDVDRFDDDSFNKYYVETIIYIIILYKILYQ